MTMHVTVVSTDALNLSTERVHIPEEGNLTVVFTAAYGAVLQVIVLSVLIVEQVNSTVWPELTFCDCGISCALEQVIPVKSKNNITSCHWLVVSTQNNTTSPFTNSVIISHLQQAADKQCTHKPAAASWQVFNLF